MVDGYIWNFMVIKMTYHSCFACSRAATQQNNQTVLGDLATTCTDPSCPKNSQVRSLFRNICTFKWKRAEASYARQA